MSWVYTREKRKDSDFLWNTGFGLKGENIQLSKQAWGFVNPKILESSLRCFSKP